MFNISEEQRMNVKFLVTLEKSATEIINLLKEVYGTYFL